MITKENALEKALEHWEANAAATTIEDVKLGSDYCPLCTVYNNDTNAYCFGCPVSIKSNRPYCENTPYGKVLTAYYRADGEGPVTDDLKKAINEELEFLRSLR